MNKCIGPAWFVRRLSVVVRTAIFHEKESRGRESDLKCALQGVLRDESTAEVVLPTTFKRLRLVPLKKVDAPLRWQSSNHAMWLSEIPDKRKCTGPSSA